MENIKAKFQMLDNYVKEYKIELKGKINEDSQINMDCSLGYGMQNVREEKKLIGQAQMVYDITLSKENEEVGKIHLCIEGLFEGDKEMGKDNFEKMLKYNGATTLSQICRAYIISNSALSGMPTITLPMINFMEFFKNADSKNQK